MKLLTWARLEHSQASAWRYIVLKKCGRILIYLLVLIVGVISLMPFIWTISTSLKGSEGIMAIPPKLIPETIVWQNFQSVFSGFEGALPFVRWLINSVFLVVINVIGETFFAAIAGYGFARFRFRMRNFLFVCMLSSAVIPGFVMLLPQYLMFSKWHWTNTYLPLILPQWFGGMFLVFLFRQYFVTVPKSLDEAAEIDGASHWMIFTKIILPLSKPIISTAAVLVYMSNWNNFWGPFIFLNDMEKYTLAVGMKFMQGAINSFLLPKEPLLAAYSLVMSVPVIVIFFLFQRNFVKGIQLSASKE